MSAKLRKTQRHADSSPVSGSPLDALRAAFQQSKDSASRVELFEGLTAFAGGSLASDGAAAAAALAEAEVLVPSPLPDGIAWKERMMMLHRTKAAHAQMHARHSDAVAEFEAALSYLPTDPASAGRDANAARVQLLVRLARSRLALGQAAQTATDMQHGEAILSALEGQIPQRPLAMVRATVLANLAVALAEANRLADAESKFETGIGLIDQLEAPELAGLRSQTLTAWVGALRAKGRGADAEDLLARLANPSHHEHDASCGCGHDHHHGHHHHQHAHDHDAHHHTHDDHHGDSCGCGSHAH